MVGIYILVSIASLYLHDYPHTKAVQHNPTKKMNPWHIRWHDLRIQISKITTIQTVILMQQERKWDFSHHFQNSICLTNMWRSRSILDQCKAEWVQLPIDCSSGNSTGCSTCNSSNHTRCYNNLRPPWRFQPLQAISFHILEEYFQQLQSSCQSRFLSVGVKSFSALGRLYHTQDGFFLTL